MSEAPSLRLLSDLVSGATHRLSRRRFVTRVPLFAAAVTACTGSEPERQGTRAGQDTTGTGRQEPPRRSGPINSDSRLDTVLVHGQHPTSHTPSVQTGETVQFHRYDPALPPAPSERRHEVHWTSREHPVRISPSVVVAAWTFEGDVPGPILHVRQGDTVEFTLTNEGSVPHSMDFHAAQVDPKTAFRSVPKGESVTYTFRPRNAGAFLYHCGTAPVLMHIGSGMFGAIIVDPPEPLPPAKEFVLVQSEYYLVPSAGGISACDFRQMSTALPDYVVFNGRPDQYVTQPIRVKKGDRVRFHVLAAGPSHPCCFHVVGEQFDNVYLAAPPASPLRGVQTFSVPPGGGMIFEFTADIAGEFPFVNHAFGHGQKGAIGFLEVEE